MNGHESLINEFTTATATTATAVTATTGSAFAEGLWAYWLAMPHRALDEAFSVCPSLAAIFSQSLADWADIAVFLTCCYVVIAVQGRRLNSDRLDSGTVVDPSTVVAPSNVNYVPWVQATASLFGLAHILQISHLPDSVQLLSTIAKLLAVATATVGFLKFKPSNNVQQTPDDTSVTESALQQKTSQLVLNQRRLDTVERNLELVLEAGQIGLWEWDPESQTFLISSSFRKLLNLPSDAIWETLEDWQNHLANEDRQSAFIDFQKFMAGDISGFESMYRMSTADGQTALILCRSELIRNEHGQIVGAHGIARDVTQKHHVRQQLRLHERAMAMSQEAVLFVHPNGQIQKANHAATKLLQRSKEQLCDLSIFDIDTNHSAQTWQDHWAALADGKPFRAALTFLLPDHRPLNCEVQYSMVSVEGKQFVVLTAIDISSRKNREAARRRHEFATDRATESVYWAREDGRLFYVNQAICRQLGYTKNALLNLRVSDLNPSLTPETWAKQWQKVKRDRFLATEAVQQSRDGETTQVATNLYFYEVEGEQFVVATGRDITAEKLAAVGLAAKTAELEQLLRSLPLGMVFVNRERKVLRVNSEFCRMFGYTPKEIEGQTAQILYANVDDFNQAGDFQKILREGPEPRRFLVKYQRKNGDMLRAETVGVVLRDIEGEVTGYLGLIKDYTEQFEVERALRTTQAALDTAADAVLWVQQNGRISYANQVACERLQYSKEELEQMTVADINPDLNSVSDFTSGFWPAIQKQGQIVVELHHQRRDGTVFPVEIMSHLQNFEGNEFTCSFVRDITDRVTSQQQLGEAQAKLELAVQSGNVSLWEWDWETGEVQVSEGYHRSLGEHPGTLTTVEEWRQRLHPDDAKKELLVVQELEQSAKVGYDRTYRIQHRDGSYRWVLSRGRLFRRPDGSPHRLVGSHVDITELRQAQLRTEAYVKLVGATDGSWDWDVEHDAVVYSPRFFELIGFSPEESDKVSGTISFLKQQIHSDDRDLFWTKIDEHFCSRDFFDHEVRLQMKSQKFRWFRFRAQTIFDNEERPVRMAGSIYDVTSQKEVELQLRRSNADLEQFAYVASHDLQEPLRAVSGFCGMLQLKYDDKLDDEGREYIRHAVDGTARMKGLIEDLLNYARIGRKDELKEVIDLKSCALEAVANLQTTIHETNADIQIHDLPDLECYPGLISRLFQNMIGNAIKFAQEGIPAKVIIRADRIEEGPYEKIQLHIVDNGIGIEQKHGKQIFQLFKRLHYQDEIPGTGLGLAICQRIVERHRGTIRVSSKVGEGSTFIITLPNKLRT